MSILGRSFNEIAVHAPEPKRDQPEYPPPYSIRFTFEERAQLDAERGRQTLSAYIRERLFGEDPRELKAVIQKAWAASDNAKLNSRVVFMPHLP